MKKTGILALSLFGIGAVFAYVEFQNHKTQSEQLANYERHVQKLLSDIERSSLSRIETEKQVTQLSRQLNDSKSSLTSLSSQLESAQQQSNPDYQAMEQKIRREVRNELALQSNSIAALSRAGLLRQLSQLDPAEMGEIMTLQSQYGGFLQSLDVSDARLEIIVDGLSNMISEQNQARMELMSQMRQQDGSPRNMRREMQAINNPEVQREALSFVLTEEELALLAEYQANQPRNVVRSFVTSDGSGFVGNAVGNEVPIMINAQSVGPNGNFEVEIIAVDPQ